MPRESRSDRILAELEAERLARARKPAPPAPRDPTRLILGLDPDKRPISISARARLEHTHVIGASGGGKSKFLEHCILQDIAMGHGVCLVDPHGNHRDSLYRAVLTWVGTHKMTRPVHVIDPNAPTHTVGFNPLARPDTGVALSVIAAATLEAFERVWGDEKIDEKPTMQRVLEATFVTLAELGLTLAEAELLYDPDDTHGIRALVRSKVMDRTALSFLARLDRLGRTPREFDMETIGPLNRISKLTRSPAIRAIIGQTETSIDFRAVLDEGHVVLVNLSGGDAVYDDDADLLGRLLTRFLFFHAKRRAHPERPFFVYLDECHRYLSGDIPNLLAEARKYGLGTILSHQFLQQLGEPQELLRHAVLNTTNFKAVFRLQNPAEAAELAEAIMPLDYEMPLKASVRPTVVGHKRTLLTSESVGEQMSVSETEGHAIGIVEGETFTRGIMTADSVAEGRSEGQTVGKSRSTGLSIGETSGFSEASGMMAMTASGASTGTSAGEVMTPVGEDGLFLAAPDPTILSTTRGESGAQHTSSGTGASSQRSAAHGNSRASSASQGETRASSTAHSLTTGRTIAVSEAYGEIRARTETVSKARGVTKGVSSTKGTSETFEPVYADLPSSFHSKENVLSMAADVLRGLTAGRAFVGFVDQVGRKSSLLAVPLVQTPELSQAAFEALRERMLAASPSAENAEKAASLVLERERLLMRAARVVEVPPPDPTTFREPLRKPKLPKKTRPETA
jgi:DNA helicase HerA-like ATPase